MPELTLEHLIEIPDIHEVYVARYRAEHVTHHLWRIAHGRAAWDMLPAGSDIQDIEHGRGGTPSRAVPVAQVGARLAYIKIPAAVCLELDAHVLSLTGSALAEAMRRLSRAEPAAWEEFIAQPRHSAVFSLVKRWAMTRRNSSASEALGRAALMVGAACEVVG